eukprot:337359_1
MRLWESKKRFLSCRMPSANRFPKTTVCAFIMTTPQVSMIKHKPNMKKTRVITSAPVYCHDHYNKMKKQKSKYRHGSAMHDTFESLGITFNENDVSDDDNDLSISTTELDPIDEKNEYQTNSQHKTLTALPSLFRSTSTPISDIQHFEIDQIALTIWGNHQFELHEVYSRLTHTKRSSRMNIGKPMGKPMGRPINTIDEFEDNDQFHEIEDDEFLDDEYYDELDQYEDNYLGIDNINQMDDIKNDTQNEAIRQYLIKEIVDTEESYVQGLTTLLYEFIQPLFDQKMIK